MLVEIEIRLDRYLRQLYPALTQGLIQKALRLGKIKVNNKKAKADLRITKNDKIFVADSIVPKTEENIQNFSVSVVKLANKILGEYLIYSDENLIAINKPASLATQGGSKINLSIDDALKYLNYQDSSNKFKLVHRLDKETSGILLIAKNYEASIKLTNAFQEKNIHKIYIAIVSGVPNKDSGQISSLIQKEDYGKYEKITESKDGKYSATNYKLIKILDEKRSLIEFNPLTGRMHQIRLHAVKLNCPIIGDKKYFPESISKRMLLHAKKVIIPNIIFGKEIIINCKEPNYFI